MRGLIAFTLVGLMGCANSRTQPADHAVVTPEVASVRKSKVVEMSETPVISCNKGADTRTLNVIKKASGCSLDYEKFGRTTAVAQSVKGFKYCRRSEKKIWSKLEKAGFNCT
jgi:hypothetical protein